jgi:protein-tyrosine phosphatase
MHCAAGKDRAGLSIAVTLMALGVEQEAIEADYLESNSPHRRYKMRSGGKSQTDMAPEVVELLAPLFDARAVYLAAALTTIDETWGSVDRYLSAGLGLDAATLERLRDRMLEDA